MGDLNNLQSQLNEEMHLLKEKTNELESLHKKMLILQSTELLLKNANDQNMYLSKELENKRNHIEKFIFY